MDFTILLRKFHSSYKNLITVSTSDHRSAGVPQIVLPLWVDLYNYAQLAEHIGVGVWGCRETSPEWTPECLTDAIVNVASGPNSEAFRAKAKEISAAASAQGVGRDISAGIVAGLARSGRA